MGKEKELWESFEDAFRAILIRHKDFFGLEAVEPAPVRIQTASGYVYAIEVVGYAKSDHKIVLFECRRRTTRNLIPEDVDAFSRRIERTSSQKGYFVTTLSHGLSQGAQQLADYDQIGHIQLSACATPDLYVMSFLNQVFAGTGDRVAFTCEFRCKVYDKNGVLVRES